MGKRESWQDRSEILLSRAEVAVVRRVARNSDESCTSRLRHIDIHGQNTFFVGTAPFGRIETRLLREKRGQPADSRRVKLTPLLPFIKKLTQSMLRLSDQLAVAAIDYLGLGAPSGTHALSGVYVPALHGLDSYEPPVESPKLEIVVECLHKCKDYHAASKLGFPDGYWWQFLIGLSERFTTCPVYIGLFDEGPPDVLVDWKIIFAVNGKKFGVVARDMIVTDKTWLQGAQENLEKFVADAQLEKAALVTRVAHSASGVLGTPGFPLVVRDQPPAAARVVFELLTA